MNLYHPEPLGAARDSACHAGHNQGQCAPLQADKGLLQQAKALDQIAHVIATLAHGPDCETLFARFDLYSHIDRACWQRLPNGTMARVGQACDSLAELMTTGLDAIKTMRSVPVDAASNGPDPRSKDARLKVAAATLYREICADCDAICAVLAASHPARLQ